MKDTHVTRIQRLEKLEKTLQRCLGNIEAQPDTGIAEIDQLRDHAASTTASNLAAVRGIIKSHARMAMAG